MTLINTNEPIVRLISKAAEVDEAGAMELLRLATHDYLVEQIEQSRPMIDRDMTTYVAKRTAEARRALVKTYVSKRVDNQDVDEVIQTATHLAAVSETIAKAGSELVPAGSTGTGHDVSDEPRNIFGRWTKRFGDALSALTGTDAHREVHNLATATHDTQLRADAKSVLTGTKYDNLHRIGAGLVATGHPGASAVGTAAMIGAAIGPEASTVLGPHIQRTAYRYRGTEKTADAGLRREINSKTVTEAEIKSFRADPEAEKNLRARASRGENEASTNVLAYYMNHPKGRAMSDQQLMLRIRGDVAAGYLSKKIPDPDDVALSIASGQIPPSTGVIINSAGNVVSESMGYNGDHFLPFDLKNLTGLHGGQYVRTRASGGPTSEDIYTGLMSGARQMQVVSNSGVFTMEFDPDLRGSRRYSDKAHDMITRYQKILDAVDSQTLLANDLTDAEKNKIRRSAFDDAQGNLANAKTLGDERIEAEQNRRKFNVKTPDEIEDEAKAELKEYIDNHPRGESLSRDARADKLREIIDGLYEDQKTTSVRALKLDGEGYYRAMKALQTEFPYYIRSVDHQERPRFLQERHLGEHGVPLPARGKGTDQGYVQAGALGMARNHAVSVAGRMGRWHDRREVTGEDDEPTSTSTGQSRSQNEPRRRDAASPKLPEADSPKLSDILSDRKIALEAKVANDGVMGLAEGMSKETLAGLSTVQENEITTSYQRYPETRLMWANMQASNDREGILADVLRGKASPKVTQIYVDALNQFEQKISNVTTDMDTLLAGREGVETSKALLAFRDPWSPHPDDVLGSEARESTSEGRPMFYEDIDSAGIAEANYPAVLAMQTPEVRKAVADFKGMSNSDISERIQNEYNDWDTLEEEKKATPAEVANARSIATKTIEAQQKAWSYIYAANLAAKARAITGRGRSPKVSGETPGKDIFTDYGKRDSRARILWLTPGSQAAEEFRKRLGLSTPPPKATRY